MPKTDIHVQLSGTDGNVFALSSRVSNALKYGGHRDLAEEFVSKLLKCDSYDHALQLMMEYVEVS